MLIYSPINCWYCLQNHAYVWNAKKHIYVEITNAQSITLIYRTGRYSPHTKIEPTRQGRLTYRWDYKHAQLKANIVFANSTKGSPWSQGFIHSKVVDLFTLNNSSDRNFNFFFQILWLSTTYEFQENYLNWNTKCVSKIVNTKNVEWKHNILSLFVESCKKRPWGT